MTTKALITVSTSDSEEDFGYATSIKGSMVDIGVLLSEMWGLCALRIKTFIRNDNNFSLWLWDTLSLTKQAGTQSIVTTSHNHVFSLSLFFQKRQPFFYNIGFRAWRFVL